MSTTALDIFNGAARAAIQQTVRSHDATCARFHAALADAERTYKDAKRAAEVAYRAEGNHRGHILRAGMHAADAAHETALATIRATLHAGLRANDSAFDAAMTAADAALGAATQENP